MTSMLDSAQAETRLRRSLAEVRREIDDIVRVHRGELGGKDSFEATIRNAMARMRKLLGLKPLARW